MTRHILTIAALAGLWITTAFGALTWDADGSGPNNGGTGPWNTTDLTWYNGASHQAWADNNDVVLGGTAGTLTLAENITIGSNSTNLILNATTSGYQINGDVGGLYKLTIDGTGGVGGYRVGVDGALTINAPVVLKGYDLDLRSGTKTLNGVVSDDGTSRTLVNQAYSTLVLNNANTFSWTVSNGGTLVLGNDQALGTGTFVWTSNAPIMAANGQRSIANTFTENAWNTTYVLAGHDSLTLTAAHSFPTGPWGDKSTFNVVESDAVLTFSNATGNTGYPAGFYKTGAGTLALGSFTNPNTGLIEVQSGTLLANGSFDASGMTVSSAATVGGTGTIHLYGGTVTVNAGSPNGTLAPGDSVGILTVNGTVDLNGTLAIEIDGTGADKLVVSGLLDLDPSTSILNVTFINGYTATGGATYDILDWTTLTGSFSQVNLQALGGFYSWDSSSLLTDGTLTLSIPEPASVTLVLGLAGLALRRRR